MSEDSIFCRWDLTSSNAIELGCKGELKLHGMLKAVYSVYNKLMYIEETFDVMSFMQHLRRITGKNEFLVIPNTPTLAREVNLDARIITEGLPPYRILFASEVSDRIYVPS